MRLPSLMPTRSDDALAIVNGLAGDSLEERGSPLATPMTLRTGDTVLPLDTVDRRALAAALDDADVEPTGRICVLVHGLMSTESIWKLPGAPGTTYGTELAAEHGLTVLSLRYNTGRRIVTNGRELAELLARLVRAWPVRVREIDLIGHSMGGLVIRAACHVGWSVRPRGRRWPFGRPWPSLLRRVVLIGVPNTGAGLASLVDSVGATLASVPIPAVRVIGERLERRSAGIKDLRRGTILDDDAPASPSSRLRRRLTGRADRGDVGRRTRELIVVGTVTGDPDGRVSRLLGDAIVGSDSAAGRSPDGDLFPDADTLVMPRITHNALAHHPDVAAAIAAWW